jgi:hypothetical protein
MQTVDDQTNEMEMLRKKVNREVSLSNGISEPKVFSPKTEPSTNREEVAGLKYVICFLPLIMTMDVDFSKAHRSGAAKRESGCYPKD